MTVGENIKFSGAKKKLRSLASPSTRMPMRSPSVPVVGYLIFRASSSAIANDLTALEDHLGGIIMSVTIMLPQEVPKEWLAHLIFLSPEATSGCLKGNNT